VDYTPLYYMINGQAFDKTTPADSLFARRRPWGQRHRAGAPGQCRPADARACDCRSADRRCRPGFSLIAEDGNVLPGVPRVQSEVSWPRARPMT